MLNIKGNNILASFFSLTSTPNLSTKRAKYVFNIIKKNCKLICQCTCEYSKFLLAVITKLIHF